MEFHFSLHFRLRPKMKKKMFFGRPIEYTTKGLGFGLHLQNLGLDLEIKVLVLILVLKKKSTKRKLRSTDALSVCHLAAVRHTSAANNSIMSVFY